MTRKGRHKVYREPRQKIACCRCRKRKKRCKPPQEGRGRCVDCERSRVPVCQFLSVKDDPSMKKGKSSSLKGSSTPTNMSSNQGAFSVFPLSPPDNNNSGIEFLTLQQDIQSPQTTSSSSNFQSPSIYGPESLTPSSSSRSTSYWPTSRRLGDDHRAHYSTSDSESRLSFQSPADSLFAHSIHHNSEGQHMGNALNYPSPAGYGTPLASPDFPNQAPSHSGQNQYLLNNDISPPFEESLRHRGHEIPFYCPGLCVFCLCGIPHQLCHR